MAHSLDLRKRVVNFVKSGGSKAEAARRFDVSKWCVDDWCKRKDLMPLKPPGRPRKSYWKKLEQDMLLAPDKLLRERAAEYGVRINAVWYACKQMNITHKKNTEVSGEET